MSLQTQEPVLETPPETLAPWHPHPVTLTPPYPGVYEQVWAPGSNRQLFWWHIVKKPRIGEAVVQLGTSRPSHYWAKARGGFKHFYRARANGYHDLTIEVMPGPITRKEGAAVSAVAWVQGIGGTFRSVPVYSWRRTTLTIPDVMMRYGYLYTIVVAGDVFLPPPRDRKPYGEFIGTFSKIEVAAPYYAAFDEEQEAQARFEQAIGEFESLEEMCASFAGSDDGAALAHAQDVGAEELAALGDAGLVTTNW